MTDVLTIRTVCPYCDEQPTFEDPDPALFREWVRAHLHSHGSKLAEATADVACATVAMFQAQRCTCDLFGVASCPTCSVEDWRYR